MDIDPGLVEKIKQNNDEFEKLFNEHAHLKSKVEEFNKMKYLTPEQEVEKKRHQKQKLKTKDRIEKIIQEYQTSMQ